MPDQDFTIAIDFNKRKVGCAILQSSLGATVSNSEIAGLPWLLSPTDHLRLYEVNDDTRHLWEQLKKEWSE